MKDKLTILGVFPSPEIRTGGHRRFLELMRGLEERGHTVLLLRDPDVRGGEGRLPGTTVGLFADPTPKLLKRLIPAWFRYLRSAQKRVDLLHAETPHRRPVVVAFSTTDYFAARSIANHLNAPLLFAFRSNIVTIHRRFGMLYKEARHFKGLQRFVQGYWKRFLEWRITHGSDRVVYQSEYDRDEVVGRNPTTAERSVVIPNSMRASWFPPELARANRSSRCTRLIYLGSIGERKGIQHLMPAIRELYRERRVEFSLDVIGFGGLEPWAREYTEREGLSGCVRFLGRDPAPLGRLAEADLLVVPSLYDSFPNTVLEALYVGTPVIGSDTSGIRAILESGELLFEPQNSEAIADALEPIIRDSEQYHRIRELCERRRDAFDFDWYGEFEGVLYELVRDHRAERRR